LAVECERQGFAVGLVTNGTLSGNRSPLVSIARSARQSTMILETLAGVEMTFFRSIVENLRQVKGLNSGVSCVFFALHPHESSREATGILGRKKISVTMVYCEEPGKSGCFREGRSIPLDHLLLEASPA
jgi:hypothetical protein